MMMTLRTPLAEGASRLSFAWYPVFLRDRNCYVWLQYVVKHRTAPESYMINSEIYYTSE